jgi:hypothetical protein
MGAGIGESGNDCGVPKFKPIDPACAASLSLDSLDIRKAPEPAFAFEWIWISYPYLR